MLATIAFNLAMAGIDAFVAFDLRRHRNRNRHIALVAATLLPMLVLARIAGEDGFGALRLLAWGVFLHAPVLLLMGTALWKPHRWFAVASLAVVVAIAGIGIFAFLVEPHRLEVSKLTIASPKLRRPIRIVVLSDLQTDRFGDYERDVIRRALAEQPDLLLLPGDYIQERDAARRASQIAELRSFLKSVRFSAPLGVYAVAGNVEYPDWQDIFADLPVVTSNETRTVELEDFRITLLSLRDSFDPRFAAGNSDKFHVVFGHAPDFALGSGGDLLVAGHCHGGQVRLPFLGPLITLSTIPRRWTSGMTVLGPGRTLVVSRGVGMERGHAPRLRFLCRPELVVIELGN